VLHEAHPPPISQQCRSSVSGVTPSCKENSREASAMHLTIFGLSDRARNFWRNAREGQKRAILEFTGAFCITVEVAILFSLRS
jgi:hypothetical protein